MSMISPVMTRVMRPLYKGTAKASEWTLKHGLQSVLDKGLKDPVKFAGQMLVTSIVSKDLVGCVLYTTQSWNNKKIPEKKRKFVAMVDLMNGIVMVGGQYLIGKIIDKKISPKIIANKITGINKLDPNGHDNSNALLASDHLFDMTKKFMLKNKALLEEKGLKFDEKTFETQAKKYANIVIENIGNESQYAKSMATGLGIVITALATTALTKRTLAPLISTPMASWANHKFIEKPKKGQTNQTIEEQPKENVKEVKTNDVFGKVSSK